MLLPPGPATCVWQGWSAAAPASAEERAAGRGSAKVYTFKFFTIFAKDLRPRDSERILAPPPPGPLRCRKMSALRSSAEEMRDYLVAMETISLLIDAS
jgi:hypothetical protein